jgi:hypothetical protein
MVDFFNISNLEMIHEINIKETIIFYTKKKSRSCGIYINYFELIEEPYSHHPDVPDVEGVGEVLSVTI